MLDAEDETTLAQHQEEKLNAHYNDMEKKLKDQSTQLLFTSATIPRGLKTILADVIDCNTELKIINTSKVNKLMFHVPQKFIRTNATKRKELLLQLLSKEMKGGHNKHNSIMIFSHRTNTAAFVHKFLTENNIENELLIKTLSNEQRAKVVRRFFAGEIRVLVCTDIASRGWDTMHVNHVVNFEMPKFIADYMHRIGRVGRLNHGTRTNGLVTNYVTSKFEVDLVWNIEKSVRLNRELDNVNANVKRFYNNMYGNENSFQETAPRGKFNLFKEKENASRVKEDVDDSEEEKDGSISIDTKHYRRSSY